MAIQRDKVIASAEKLVAKGKIEPAIKEYERLLDDNPNDVNTLNRIGDLWVRINRNDEAVKVFGKIADHYSKDGFFLKAIAIYKKINKLDPSKLEVYAKLADLYAKQGLAMEAKSQYQVLADYYIKHGDQANALGIYRKISQLDPQSINVHVKLADLHSQVGQTAEALKEYDRVGRLLLKRGMLDEAVQVFRKALKIDPKNIDLVESLVTALNEAKDHENAKQIVDAALEANNDHPRLLSMLGRIQLARGDAQGARLTLEKALAADPDEVSAREALAELYLRQSNPNGALEMAAPAVERSLSRGERGAAIEMLNRILRVDSGHTPTLERLVAVYTRLNEETNILASMNSLAEAHIARMRFEDAAQVLEKLIQREPQNAQHRTKLQFVRSQMGGIDTMPVSKAPAQTPSLPSLEIEEPAPTFDMSEPSGSDFSLDLDASPPLELELDMPAPSPRAPAPAPTPTHLMPATEIAAAELAGDDDLDFITEHLTEAEVFAKYGLAEKAAEHLRAVLERSPKNLTAHERLFRILLEEGENEPARAAALAYVSLLQETGDKATIAEVRNEFITRGQTLDISEARGAAAVAKPAPEVVGEVPEELEFDLEAGAEMEFDLDAAEPEALTLEDEAAESPVVEETLIELPAIDEPVIDEPVLEEPIIDEPIIDEPSIDFEEVPALEPLAAAEIAEEPIAEELPGIEDLSIPEPEAVEEVPVLEESDALFEPESAQSGVLEDAFAFDEAPVSAADFSPAEGDAFAELGQESAALEELPEELSMEELGEIDFYIQQDLHDEARQKLDLLAVRFPDHPELTSRRQRIDETAAAAARPAALSRDEIETELLSAIPDDDEPISTPQPLQPPSSTIVAAPAQEENLFADEENFFDLAAELESELADDEPISLSEEEQSLEEIFKEFKKGVEQQLDSEDYDTHYNLGIAYKEMGLIDEAIGEFQLASKDPKRAVECASMLGLCFLEKGMPQLAIKWYRKGLEMPEIGEEEHTGLLYDLASAYQEVGDTDQAQKAFMEVYGMNSTYRDIVSRIKQLEDAKR